jgi:hypothetical protein
VDETIETLAKPVPAALVDPLLKYGDGQLGLVDVGANFVEIAVRWAWETFRETLPPGAPGSLPITAVAAAELAINEAVMVQVQLNRAMAAQLAALAELFDIARTHPHTYLTEGGLSACDSIELAERCAAFDAGLRLHLSPGQVRNRAHEGRVLSESLPRLWALFQAGETGYAQASAAVHSLTGLTNTAAIERYDTELAAKARELTPSAFGQKARRLADRLRAEPPELRHARAMVDRRIVVEPAPDGMAWIHAYVAAQDAVLIKRRLDLTAKNTAKKQAQAAARSAGKAGRRQTRDQIRADLFVRWLTGADSPTAAKVRVLLFVPLLGLLAKTNTQSAVLEGYGPIDPVSVAQLFSDAPSFRRVGTDPFSGEILNFDRRRYRPTRAQREYLAMKYGTCGTPGCDRLAVTSDLDHLKEWAKDHGLTNEDNLVPLCAPDHRLKTLTKIRYKREPDGAIVVTTPTGTSRRKVPPKPLPDNPPF